MVSETTISEQECRLPGTRTRPFPSSPRWIRSSMAFSSSMLVGRRTRSGRKEIELRPSPPSRVRRAHPCRQACRSRVRSSHVGASVETREVMGRRRKLEPETAVDFEMFDRPVREELVRILANRIAEHARDIGKQLDQ